MNIDQQSFIIGAIAGAGVIALLQLVMFILKPWRHAFFSGAPVPLLGIVGMRLRGNPPMLLIDAFIKLRKIPVDTSIQEVEVVFIQNKVRASTPDALVRLVQEYREKHKN